MSSLFNSVMTSSDIKKACLASLIPGSGAVVSYAVFSLDTSAKNWWRKMRKPSWVPTNTLSYTVVDFITTLPLGCASYLVYKHGGGFKSTGTCVALAAYGTNVALASSLVPLMLKFKDIKMTLVCILGIHGTADLMSVLFYKVYPKASYMAIPYVLWSAFYAVLFASIYRIEKKKYEYDSVSGSS